MSALVYKYGCGEVISGLDHADAEAERMHTYWDRLVEIDRAWAAHELREYFWLVLGRAL